MLFAWNTVVCCLHGTLLHVVCMEHCCVLSAWNTVACCLHGTLLCVVYMEHCCMLFECDADMATQLGNVDEEESTPQTLASPKPMPTKTVSWASSTTSSYDSEQQEMVLLRSQLKDVMKSNLE